MKRFLTILFCVALCTSVTAPAFAEERGPIDALVEKFIMEHPEVIIKSLKKYKTRDKITAEHQEKLKNSEGSPSVGNPKGDVTLVEFFDYHCGYCKRFYAVVNQLIEQDKNLKVVFKELPILSEDSELAAHASLAVNSIAPEKYFGFHSALMKTQGTFTIAKLTDLAKQAGIGEQEFLTAMKSKKVNDEIESTKALAEELDISGTPLIIIGKQMIPGAVDIETLRAKIAMEREAAKKQ